MIDPSTPASLSGADQRAELGAELARVRTERGLSPADVGRTLLLSTRQVLALEQVEPAAFHNALFYDTALRRYAKFCDVGLDRFELRPHTPVVVAPVAKPELTDVEPARWPRAALNAALSVATVVFLAGVVAAALLRRPASPPAVPAVPATGVPALALPLLPSDDEMAALAAASTAPRRAPVRAARYGTVRALQATWIYLRLTNGSVTEREMREGETIGFDERPVFLVVGSPDVILTIDGAQIDTSPFIERGQLRMSSRNFQPFELVTPPDLQLPEP